LYKIFDPFFTTKPKTGSGLGLWVTREIVQKHGGTIRARSTRTRQKHGSVFTIMLPGPGSVMPRPAAHRLPNRTVS
jgi:signal transduction histidine kinase